MKTKKNFLKKLTAGILGFVMTLGVGAAGYAASANETHAADTYELVTDASTLKSGDKLVIASNAKGTTAGNISSSIMSKVASTFSTDKKTITTLGSGTIILTLGGSSGAWTLSNSSGQNLGATAVKKVAWGSGTTTWSISISSDNATIQNGTSSYGRFLYNANSGQERFTTYTSSTSSSMLLPQLYRLKVSTFSVTYDSNGATSGSVPIDSTAYNSGAAVTVKDNTGNLVKSDYTFSGWNSNATGTGTDYPVGSTFNISANTTLYAKWTEATTPTISVASTLSGYVGETKELSVSYSHLNTGLYVSNNSSCVSLTQKSDSGSVRVYNVTFSSAGNATLSFKDGESAATALATCSVTSSKLSITLSKTSTSIQQGKSETITATVASGSVTWSSNNAKITVSGGTISVASDASIGSTAAITATSSIDSSASATCTVTVIENPFASFTLLNSVDQVTTSKVYAMSTEGTYWAGPYIYNSTISASSTAVSAATTIDAIGYFKLESNSTGGYSLKKVIKNADGSFSDATGNKYINYSGSSTNLGFASACSYYYTPYIQDGHVSLKLIENNRYFGWNNASGDSCVPISATNGLKVYTNPVKNTPAYLWEVPQNNLTSLSVSGQQTTFKSGELFGLGSGAVVKATYSATGEKTVTTDLSYTLGGTAITLPYTLKLEDNNKEVVVTYTDSNGASASATAYTINVGYADVTSVELSQTEVNVGYNQEFDLSTISVTISPSEAEQVYAWAVYDNGGLTEGDDFTFNAQTKKFNSRQVEGEVILSCTSGSKADYLTISILGNPIAQLSDETVEGIANVTAAKSVSVIVSNYTSISGYSWVSSDSTVASVSGNGNSASISFLKQGSCTVTVTVSVIDKSGNPNTASDTLTVNVTKQLASINAALTEAAKDNEYTENTSVPLTDIVIEKVYSDGSKVPGITTGFSFVSGKDKPSIADPTVTVTFTEGGITKTASVTVTVTYATLSGVSKSGTFKDEFNAGDNFEFGSSAGLTAKYTNSAFSDETIMDDGEFLDNIRGTYTVTLERKNNTTYTVVQTIDLDEGYALSRADNGLYVHIVYSYHGSNEAPNRYQITVNAPVLDVKYMGQEESSWNLVTSVDELTNGSIIVISGYDSYTATNSLTSGYLGNVSSTYNTGKDKITTLGNNTLQLVVEVDSSGNIQLKENVAQNPRYLGQNNDKFTFATDVTTDWEFDFGDNGVVTMGDDLDQNAYRILYNVNSPRFKPYNSSTSASMVLPKLYKYTEGGEVEKTAHPSEALYDVFAQTQDISASNWDTYGSLYSSFMTQTTSEDYTVLNKGIRDAGGNIAEKFLATYDSVLASNPSLNNFLNRPIMGGTYLISYFEADGTPITDSSLVTSYKNGVGATLVDAQDKAAYSFAGWYDNAQLSGSPVTSIPASATGNKNFYAKWEFSPYDCMSEVDLNFGMSFKYTYNDNPVVTRDANENKDYELVTDVSTLKAEDKILIVGIESSTYYALAPYVSGNNCKRNEVSDPDNNIISTNAAYLTLGGSASSWTLYDGTNYLYAAGGTSSNNLKGIGSADADTAKWTITIAADGKATIVCVDTATTRNTIRHNTGSDLFSCYASGQADVYIYKMKDSTPSPYKDVEFKLSVKTSGMDDLAQNFENGEDYGIVVTYNDGTKNRELYFSFVADGNGYYWYSEWDTVDEEWLDPVQYNLKSNGSFLLNLGDVINEISRASTEFTIGVYADDGEYIYTLEDGSISTSIKDLIEGYYNNPATRTQQVIDLYNIFFPAEE